MAYKKKQMKIKKSEIYKYWEGRGIFDIDYTVPLCFACGVEFGGGKNNDVYTRYDKATGIQRCHIIPESLGGKAEPNNLILLCSSCHRESPNVNDGDILINWCANHESHISIAITKFKEALKYSPYSLRSLESDMKDVELAIMVMENMGKDKEFNQWYLNNAGLHFGATVTDNLDTFINALMMYVYTKVRPSEQLSEQLSLDI